MDESEYVERLAGEYRRVHLALGALQRGLEVAGYSLDVGDSEWAEIELEKLYLHLDALGAAWRVDEIELSNSSVLNKIARSRPTHLIPKSPADTDLLA